MPTRNVVLTDHHEGIIETLVRSGRYQNASEVLREGLRLIENRESRDAARLVALKTAADAGFSDLDQGHFTELDDAGLETFIADLGLRASDLVTKRP